MVNIWLSSEMVLLDYKVFTQSGKQFCILNIRLPFKSHHHKSIMRLIPLIRAEHFTIQLSKMLVDKSFDIPVIPLLQKIEVMFSIDVPDEILTESDVAMTAQQEELIKRLNSCSPKDKETALQLLSVFLKSLD